MPIPTPTSTHASTKKILFIGLIALCIAVLGSLFIHHTLRKQASAQAEKSLRQVLIGLVEQISQTGEMNTEWIKTVYFSDTDNNTATQRSSPANHFRLTILNIAGDVIADNHGNPAQMDNHLLRPEIKAALLDAQHIGSSQRRSRSVGVDYLYIAQAVFHRQQHLGFVRIAMPQKYINDTYSTSFYTFAIPLYLCILYISSTCIFSSAAAAQPTLSADAQDTGELATERVSSSIWHHDHSFHLSDMLNSLNESIITVDVDNYITYVNDTAIRILSCADEQIIGSSLWSLGRINIIPETIHACLQDGIEKNTSFTVLQHAKELHYRIHVTPIFTNAQVHGAIAVIQDSSDQHHLDDMRRNFFTNISHELKTPLAVIRAVIETMIDDTQMPAAQQQKFLQKADNNCTRLNTLVSDILTISKLEEPQSQHDHENISLNDILRECTTLIQNSADNKQMELDVHIPDTPCIIQGDRELIRQVCDNLLSNAINYSPPKSHISAHMHISDTHFIIRVSDNGPGIAPQAIERIFERFYRVDKARSRQVGGTGLGLAIAKHAVALHGGEISVISEVSLGSTFTIHLPKTPLSS